MTNYIAYYRVSTKQQGASGLGLEAQEASVINHVNGHGKLIASYTEVESGKKSERIELAKALGHAKRNKATLIVAKLDRLSRNVAFLSALMESKVDFVCADMPTATKLTIHIMAAMAEHEGKVISERTKAALVQAKKRGIKLGSHREGHWEGREQTRIDGLVKARKQASKTNKAKKIEAYADLLPQVTEYRVSGKTFQEIANILNDSGHLTRRGKSWSHVQILRLVKA